MISSLSIGQHGHRIPITTIAPVTEPIWKKSACFDKLESTLKNQLATHAIPDIISALDEVLPIEVSAAIESATNVKSKIIAAATKVINLEPLTFLDAAGSPLDVPDADITKRPEHITFIQLTCRLQGKLIDKRINQPDLHFDFALALPQYRKNNQTGVVESIFQKNSASPSASKQSRLFKTSQPSTSTTTTSSLNGFTTSWYGRADLLDTQEAFDLEFTSTTPPLLHADPKTGSAAEVHDILHRYADLCQFDVAMSLCRCDYVGSNNAIDSILAVQEVCKELCAINQEYREKNGKKNLRCPDEIFTKYLELTPSLPDDTSIWTIRLCSTYFNALMNDLKDKMLSNNFKMPPPSVNNSKERELDDLREVREAAVTSYKKLTDDLTVMSRFLSAHNPLGQKMTGKHLLCAALIDSDQQHPAPVIQERSRSVQFEDYPPSHFTGQIYKYSSTSPAEATIQRYKPPANRTRTDPLTKRRADGQLYPYHPDEPGFLSKFPLNFKGCLSCGSTDHWRNDKCPVPQSPAIRQEFFKELFAHKPHLKKFRGGSPSSGTVHMTRGEEHGSSLPPVKRGRAPPSPPMQQSSGTSTRTMDNTPAWLRQIVNGHTTRTDSIDDDDGHKKHRLFVHVAKILVSNGTRAVIRRMPLELSNKLPGIVFQVGPAVGKSVGFLCHLDTCAAMNTGNLKMHQYIMTEHPELVINYSRYDDRNPFLPIELQCALTEENNDATTNEANKLTAVVTYRTPYTDKSNEPITLSFGLGENVSVRTIIGLPTLKAWQGVIDFVQNKFVSHTIGKRFDLMFEETQQGLPAGIKFHPNDFKRPVTTTSGNVMKIAAKSFQSELWESAITDGCNEAEHRNNEDQNNEEE